MVGAYVNSCSGAEIVVSDLRYQRVGAFDRKDVEQRHVAALGNLANLRRRQHRIALVQTCSEIPRNLDIEHQRIDMIAMLEAGVVQTVSEPRDLKSARGVNRSARCGSGVSGARKRARQRNADSRLNQQDQSLSCRGKLNLVRMAIELNVRSYLIAPFLVELLVHQHALVEKVG